MRTPSSTAPDFVSGRGGSDRRPIGAPLTLTVLLLVIAGLAVTATPALAITSGHTFSFQFGSFGTGNGQFEAEGYGLNIGVDQSTGIVYVADSGNHRVERFSPNGTFLGTWGFGVSDGKLENEVCNAPSPCLPGIAGGAPGQLEWPNGIAVDNSGGPNDGDVYVVDNSSPFNAGRQAILKFDPTGTYLNTIDGSESPAGTFGFVAAATVDSRGFVWVTTGNNTMAFSNEAENEYVSGSQWEGGGYALGINAARTKLYIDNHAVNTNGTNPAPPYTPGFGALVDHSTGHVYSFVFEDQTRVQEFTESGEPVGPPFISNTEPYYCLSLGQGGMALNESTNTVYVIDPCHGVVYVFVPRIVPDVITEGATNIGHTGATLTGHVTPDPTGGGNVTNCHFEIGTAKSYGTSVPCAQALPFSGGTEVSADVSGLAMDITYHYRLVAANSVDANSGADRTFTTHRVIGLTTEGATDVGQSSATINGSFDPGGDDTHYFFEWGPTTGYGNVTSAPPGLDAGASTGSMSVSTDITGLKPYATYHYRIVASNSLGTSFGEDATLRTEPPDPPSVNTAESSEVTDTSALISASLNPNLSPTIYRIQYGVSQAYGQQIAVDTSIGEDHVDHAISARLHELKPGTTYHFRIVAANFGGAAQSPDATFTTMAEPSVEAVVAKDITASGATLEALVNPEMSPTVVRFEYGTTAGYGSSTPPLPVGADGLSHAIRAGVGALAAGTSYHYRVVAANAIGTYVSSDQTFTTSSSRSQVGPKPVACRKSRVRRHGKCVKKPSRKRHGHHRPHRGG